MKELTLSLYIASSWRNQHAVEMLTSMLREHGHTVVSFVDEARRSGELDLDYREYHDPAVWIMSSDGRKKFNFDTQGATESDLVVYVGPSGTDAWAEVGAAWGRGVPVIGLWAKGEPAGLMRRMVRWYHSYTQILAVCDGWAEQRRAELA